MIEESKFPKPGVSLNPETEFLNVDEVKVDIAKCEAWLKELSDALRNVADGDDTDLERHLRYQELFDKYAEINRTLRALKSTETITKATLLAVLKLRHEFLSEKLLQNRNAQRTVLASGKDINELMEEGERLEREVGMLEELMADQTKS